MIKSLLQVIDEIERHFRFDPLVVMELLSVKVLHLRDYRLKKARVKGGLLD